MYITQLFNMLALTEDVEIVIARLPESTHRPVLPQRHLVRARPFSAASPRNPLFQNLHRQHKRLNSRLGDQQVKVFGHHYIAPNNEIEFLPHLFENLEEQIATAR